MPTAVSPTLRDFYINVGQDPLQDLQPPRAFEVIKRHAFEGDPDHHCVGVSSTLDRLVNEVIIPNHPLTNQGQTLSTLLEGPHANEAAEAFRHAARAAGTLEWHIDQYTERLTLAVPHAPDPALNLLREPTGALSLHQTDGFLVLTVPYNYTTFFSHRAAPLLGNFCRDILSQVRHALASPLPVPQEAPPPSLSFSGTCPLPPRREAPISFSGTCPVPQTHAVAASSEAEVTRAFTDLCQALQQHQAQQAQTESALHELQTTFAEIEATISQRSTDRDEERRMLDELIQSIEAHQAELDRTRRLIQHIQENLAQLPIPASP